MKRSLLRSTQFALYCLYQDSLIRDLGREDLELLLS